jgi:5-methyltetrahydrofolate--homocysteine methyltransferase
VSVTETNNALEAPKTKLLRLSGSQPFTQQAGVYIMIGERTNVAGSPKFARFIKEGKYEAAVSIARQQVENGANVIDICMDEGMIDGVTAMTRFLQLLGKLRAHACNVCEKVLVVNRPDDCDRRCASYG